jgi:hypothetical protein
MVKMTAAAISFHPLVFMMTLLLIDVRMAVSRNTYAAEHGGGERIKTHSL